jgi:F-type H+-transporting ATPase subunit epsilon
MELAVRIINPNKILYEGKAEYVLAPSKKGVLGIMPSHTPMFAELVAGEIFIGGEREQVVPLVEGILKVRADEVTILIIS